MVSTYLIQLVLDFDILPKNIPNFVDRLLRRMYADYKVVLPIKEKNKSITIYYKLNTGAELKNSLESSLNYYIEEDDNFAEFMKCVVGYTFRVLSMMHEDIPNYLEYLAIKQRKGEKPLNPDDFSKEIEKGKFWRKL